MKKEAKKVVKKTTKKSSIKPKLVKRQFIIAGGLANINDCFEKKEQLDREKRAKKMIPALLKIAKENGFALTEISFRNINKY